MAESNKGSSLERLPFKSPAFFLHLLLIASLGGAETESLDAMLAKTFGV
jgi:hypothetical protein